MKFISVKLSCFAEARGLCGDITSDDVLIWKVSQCLKAESHVLLERKGGKEGSLSKVLSLLMRRHQLGRFSLLKKLGKVQKVVCEV